MMSKSKDDSNSGGTFVQKVINTEVFRYQSVLKCIEYQIVFYCVWNNKTTQKNLLTKVRALALDDSIYASPGISSDFFMLIIVKY